MMTPEIWTRKVVPVKRELLPEIDDWRANQRPIPSEAEALRRLLEMGLETTRKAANAAE